MIVCHCNRVTAADIEAECLGGASCSHEVRERCGAGNRCGGCRPVVQMLVSKYADRHACAVCEVGVGALVGAS